MLKRLWRSVLALAAGGLVLASGTRPVMGAILIVLALGMAGLEFAFKGQPPLDRVLQEALQQAIKLQKTDPAAASQMMESALAASEQREEQQLSELRARASGDHAAARELRDRLRFKLKIGERSRNRLERLWAGKDVGPALLEGVDKDIDAIRRRLAEAEQLVEGSGR